MTKLNMYASSVIISTGKRTITHHCGYSLANSLEEAKGLAIKFTQDSVHNCGAILYVHSCEIPLQYIRDFVSYRDKE